MTDNQQEKLKELFNRENMNVLYPRLIGEFIMEIKKIFDEGDSETTDNTK